MDRRIHCENNVWGTAQRLKKIYGFDVHAGLEETMDQLAWQTVFDGMVKCCRERIVTS